MSTITLQVPMDKSLRDLISKRAQELGFDSAQALIRYMSKAVADGRRIDFGEPYDDWGEPSPQAIARWDKQIAEHEADRKAGKLKTFANVEELMRDLRS